MLFCRKAAWMKRSSRVPWVPTLHHSVGDHLEPPQGPLVENHYRTVHLVQQWKRQSGRLTPTEPMLRRRIPFNQVAFATVLGVAGGVYIYRPYFEAKQRRTGTPEEPTTPPPHVEEQPPPPHEDNVPKNQSSPEETKSWIIIKSFYKPDSWKRLWGISFTKLSLNGSSSSLNDTNTHLYCTFGPQTAFLSADRNQRNCWLHVKVNRPSRRSGSMYRSHVAKKFGHVLLPSQVLPMILMKAGQIVSVTSERWWKCACWLTGNTLLHQWVSKCLWGDSKWTLQNDKEPPSYTK